MIASFYKQFSRQPKVAWAFFPLVYLLASAVGAKNALSKVFILKHVDGTYDDAFERWFKLEKNEMAQENENQKNWTEPIFDSKTQT